MVAVQFSPTATGRSGKAAGRVALLSIFCIEGSMPIAFVSAISGPSGFRRSLYLMMKGLLMSAFMGSMSRRLMDCPLAFGPVPAGGVITPSMAVKVVDTM